MFVYYILHSCCVLCCLRTSRNILEPMNICVELAVYRVLLDPMSITFVRYGVHVYSSAFCAVHTSVESCEHRCTFSVDGCMYIPCIPCVIVNVFSIQTCSVSCINEEVYSDHIKGKKHAKVWNVVRVLLYLMNAVFLCRICNCPARSNVSWPTACTRTCTCVMWPLNACSVSVPLMCWLGRLNTSLFLFQTYWLAHSTCGVCNTNKMLDRDTCILLSESIVGGKVMQICLYLTKLISTVEHV